MYIAIRRKGLITEGYTAIADVLRDAALMNAGPVVLCFLTLIVRIRK